MSIIDLGLNKRQKIIVASTIVTIGLLSTQLVNFNLRFRFIGGLAIIAYLVSLWALWQGLNERSSLNKTKAIVLLILPTFFTLAVASFYFLLPVRWLTRLPVAFAFGFLFYLLLLAQNVFNIAAIRTIPLYRAASTAAFLFTLLSAFFLYNVIYAFNLYFVWNGVAVMLVSFPLVLQVLWSIEMSDSLSFPTIFQSFILSLIFGELALVFSFWPMATTIWSLSLASAMYVLLGLTTQVLRERASKRIVYEYVGIAFIMLFVAFFITSWTG